MQHRFANPSLGLLALRIGVGSVMIYHGAQKLFGVFSGGGPAGTAQFFGSLGIPAPEIMAIVVGIVEFGGGLALMAGAMTHIAALLIAGTMLVAIVTVHLPQGFGGQGGYEFPLMLFLAAIGLFFLGPGHYSIDGVRHAGREGEHVIP